MNNTIDQLKDLIIKNEVVENVLIKYCSSYHVVTCSVVDYDAIDQKYLFYVEGYSCSFEIEDIDNWRLASECFW